MVYSAQAVKQCTYCGHIEQNIARFCPTCGNQGWQPFQLTTAPFAYGGNAPHPELVPPAGYIAESGTPTLFLPENIPDALPASLATAYSTLSDTHVPKFAHVLKQNNEAVRQKQVELAKMSLILARERLFLLFHFCFWFALNIVGLWLSMKCYNEFIADEMTKIMIGCSPFWVFNVLGLTCLVPIKGTQKHISRLKDQIAHLKFSIDYGHIA